MVDIPQTLLVKLPHNEQDTVRLWWSELADKTRLELVELCDERWEDCFFGPPFEGEEQPVVIGGHFLPRDDVRREAEWEEEWREYLVEHPAVSTGDGWRDGSVLIMSQFPTVCRMDSSGVRCRIAEWSRTRFAGEELPPSEQ